MEIVEVVEEPQILENPPEIMVQEQINEGGGEDANQIVDQPPRESANFGQARLSQKPGNDMGPIKGIP